MLLSSEQIWSSYNSVETGSGDRDFDRALAETLLSLSTRFFVLPGFAFFNERYEAKQMRTPVPHEIWGGQTVMYCLGGNCSGR